MGVNQVRRFKLFCTVTMKAYFVEADTELDARRKLAKQLGYPISTIDVFR